MSDFLWSRGLEHPRFPCPSLSPRIFSHLCPLSQWCYLTILCCHPSPFAFNHFAVQFSSLVKSNTYTYHYITSLLYISGRKNKHVSIQSCKLEFPKEFARNTPKLYITQKSISRMNTQIVIDLYNILLTRKLKKKLIVYWCVLQHGWLSK